MWANGCHKTIPEALRFLARQGEVPVGGEQHYNSAHLEQMAMELEVTYKRFSDVYHKSRPIAEHLLNTYSTKITSADGSSYIMTERAHTELISMMAGLMQAESAELHELKTRNEYLTGCLENVGKFCLDIIAPKLPELEKSQEVA